MLSFVHFIFTQVNTFAHATLTGKQQWRSYLNPNEIAKILNILHYFIWLYILRCNQTVLTATL